MTQFSAPKRTPLLPMGAPILPPAHKVAQSRLEELNPDCALAGTDGAGGAAGQRSAGGADVPEVRSAEQTEPASQKVGR